MKNVKFLFPLAILFSMLIAFAMISGCSTNPTGGGSSGGGSGSNTGTISGYVYLYDRTNLEYIPTSEATVTVSMETMSLEASTTTDATGHFTLTGLPTGEIIVFATQEIGGIIYAAASKANSDTFYLRIKNITNVGTTCTIEGAVTGFTVTPDSATFSVYRRSEYTGSSGTAIGTYYPITGTYEISGCPIGDNVTVLIKTYKGITIESYAYDTATTVAGNNTLNLSATQSVSMDAYFSLPAGTPAYDLNNIYILLKRGDFVIANITSEATPTNPYKYRLPQLHSGDVYWIYIDADNTVNRFMKYFSRSSAGTQSFTCSDVIPSTDIILQPSPSGTMIAYPNAVTFEYSSITGVWYHSSVDNSNIVIKAFTKSNSFELPKLLSDMMLASTSYSYYGLYPEICSTNTAHNGYDGRTPIFKDGDYVLTSYNTSYTFDR